MSLELLLLAEDTGDTGFFQWLVPCLWMLVLSLLIYINASKLNTSGTVLWCWGQLAWNNSHTHCWASKQDNHIHSLWWEQFNSTDNKVPVAMIYSGLVCFTNSDVVWVVQSLQMPSFVQQQKVMGSRSTGRCRGLEKDLFFGNTVTIDNALLHGIHLL